MNGFHIYSPEASVHKSILLCPFCLEDAEFAVWLYQYHEPRRTCLSCGFSTWNPKNEMTDAEVEKNIKHALAALGEE